MSELSQKTERRIEVQNPGRRSRKHDKSGKRCRWLFQLELRQILEIEGRQEARTKKESVSGSTEHYQVAFVALFTAGYI